MKKMEGNKITALVISAVMVTTVLAACSIDTDKLSEGISDLGNVFISESEEETEPESDPVITEVTEESTEVTKPSETEATPTPVPTATPTITPTPNPQRVDFSEYTTEILSFSGNFEVTTESFEESMHSEEDEQVVFATFAGKRAVVTDASSESIREAINIVVDGFYAEAEGAYTRMTAKAKAEYTLTGVVEEPYAVNVDIGYLSNGRVLSLLMRYDVTGAGEAARAADEAEAAAILEKPVPQADEYEAVYVAPTVAENGSSISTVYGIVDGEVYSVSMDMNEYADFFNRYGASLFFA